MADANSSPLQCIVVTPEATVLEAGADFVSLPLADGEIGIARRHSPLIGRLGYGELRINRGQQIDRYYVDGGFVQVADDVVSVLTGRALAAADIDQDAANAQLVELVHQKPAGDEALAIRDRLARQARGQLRVARHA